MKTEQEKYLDVLRKMEDCLKAFRELSPESKEQLMKNMLQVSSFQEAIRQINWIAQMNGWK